MGIITQPDEPVEAPAIILLNAGLIHHVGPSRLYVRLARHLVKQGFISLRFDFSGVGDSCPRTDNLAIAQAMTDDVQQAMSFLSEHRGVSRFILVGHCAGAWASFLTAGVDERVCGTVLMNPDAATEEWIEYDRQRKHSRYYEQYYAREALLDPQRWKKLLTGKASYSNIARNIFQTIMMNRISAAIFKIRRKLDSNPKDDTVEQKSIRAQIVGAFVQRKIQLLLLFSEGSSAIDHAHLVLGHDLDTIMQSGKGKQVIIPNADHTFTLLAGQYALMEQIGIWCSGFLLPQTDKA